MIQSFIMPHHTLTFGVSHWHSIHSSCGWLCKILQLFVFTIPLKWNVTSPENIKQPRKISTLSSFCSIFLLSFFLQSRSSGLMCYCHWNIYGCKCKHLCSISWTVEWRRCSCLLAVQINLNELCRNACLMCSLYLLDVLGFPGNSWFTTLPVFLRCLSHSLMEF